MLKVVLFSKVIIVLPVVALMAACGSTSSGNRDNVNVGGAAIRFGSEIVVDQDSIGTQEILLGDLDNDGDLDIVAINQGKANVAYLNNSIFSSGGSFSAVTIDPANAPINQPLSGDLGDIDGDTYIDLVTATQRGPNYAYINDRSGGFSSRVAIQVDSDVTRTVKMADLDKNNTLDLYAGNAGVNKVYVNSGAGSFLPGAEIGVNTDDTWSIRFADFDMEGSVDMLAGNPVGTLCMHRNDGFGALGVCEPVALPGQSGKELAIGDVDGDSDIDIIFENNSNSSQLYLNDGTGRFDFKATISSGTGFITAAALGDLDGDNDVDYISGTTGMPAGSGLQYSHIHLNNGLGVFGEGVQFGSNGDDTTAIALGDLDSDGDLDIVMGKLTGPIVVVYENTH